MATEAGKKQSNQTFNIDGQEFTMDQLVTLTQKGMNFDRMEGKVRDLENNPSFAFVDELAAEYGMNAEEYLQAIQEAREQEELMNPIKAEKRQAQDELEAMRQDKAKQAESAENYNKFQEYFVNANGRHFDPAKEDLPIEVIEALERGEPLHYAYLDWSNNNLRRQIKETKEEQAKTKKRSKQRDKISDSFLKGFDSFQ